MAMQVMPATVVSSPGLDQPTRPVLLASPDVPPASPPQPPGPAVLILEAVALTLLFISCGFYSAVPSVVIITVTQVLAWLAACALTAHRLDKRGYLPPPLRRLREAVRGGGGGGLPSTVGGDTLKPGLKPLQAFLDTFSLHAAFFFPSATALTLFLALLTLQPSPTTNIWILAFPAAILGLYSLLALILLPLALLCRLAARALGKSRSRCGLSIPLGPSLLTIVGVAFFFGFHFIIETPTSHTLTWLAVIFAVTTIMALLIFTRALLPHER